MPEEDNPDKLTLVLEPEAAAFYCQNMTAMQRAMYCNVKTPFTSDCYLVVDIGGGTVDIVAYRINQSPEPHMEVIYEPTGGAWGGTKINLKFKNYLEDLIKDKGFSRFIDTQCKMKNAKHKADLDEIVQESFECQKTIFGNKKLTEKGKITIQLNSSFMREYKDEVERAVRELHASNERHTNISDSDLRITYAMVKTFYTPVVEGILECVARVLNDVTGIHTIYLVGGFGGCQYIHLTMKTYFGEDYNFVTPREREFAVVKGAALLGKNPEFLKARRVDATYGVGAIIPFEEGKHEVEYRVPSTSEGQVDMCSDIFATFVERGDVVDSKNVYMMTFSPHSKDQKFMRVQIYSSSERDVWYVTGKRPSSERRDGRDWDYVQKIGELMIPFHNAESGDSNDRAVDVMFDFSTAEVKVSGYNRQSRAKVKLVLDLLEK